jgi:hypothetical protein
MNVGHINPVGGGFRYPPYTSLGQVNP